MEGKFANVPLWLLVVPQYITSWPKVATLLAWQATRLVTKQASKQATQTQQNKHWGF